MSLPPDPYDLANAVKQALQRALANVTPSSALGGSMTVEAKIADEMGHAYTHVVTVQIAISVRDFRR